MLSFHFIDKSLVELILAQHFYQRLLQRADFIFVRPLVAPFYSTISRPSLAPIAFVKLLLVQHLENITSDVQAGGPGQPARRDPRVSGIIAYYLKKYLSAATLQQAASSAIALPLPSHLFWSLVLFCKGHVWYVKWNFREESQPPAGRFPFAVHLECHRYLQAICYYCS